ncbi:DUF86 domain-containing protein [uncultured Tessaracoccus sp.]|uniref:HepT-like ribonuclease domain-containing protein n=1 Tax=uncultured Tessaracoccus sp. TaxID=905023 RepID=UPI00260CB0DF|nr:HepT-like ribonuclease domain-containing protein [uncultured Tessaracoccus sp.]
MTKAEHRLPELLQGCAALRAQAAYLTGLGEAEFCSSGVAGQVSRLAAAQLIIQVQALVEDLPDVAVERLPSMTLREIRGMRNRLAYGYGDIDVAMMWDTISRDVPEFLGRYDSSHAREFP